MVRAANGRRHGCGGRRIGWVLVGCAVLIAVVNLVDEVGGAHLIPAAHTPVYLVVFAALGIAGILVLVSGPPG